MLPVNGGNGFDVERAAGAVALELHRTAADRGESGQLDIAAGKGLDLGPRAVAAGVLGHLRERRQGEQAAGAGGLERCS